ncbi:MAG: helix-turn-helix domain-containing protein [Desulfobacteraceae bacterium]|nr:helix-turn-helix domain-containing protein [Desulfobacteraceae bacterium]
MKVGNKIRRARQKLGINMKDFASRIGVSYLTLYRVETDKVSPSVALLSEIAHHLGEPIVNFFNDEKRLTLVRPNDTSTLTADKMTLELLIPKGVIDNNISVTRCRTEPGEFVSSHTHQGFELTYHLKGNVLFRYGDQEYQIGEGDLLYFDASVQHSVYALEPHEFLSIYFRK